MAYDFVYTDQLESVYKGKLDSNLKVYESEVRKTLLGSRANYNVLKNRYNNPINETEDNSELLANFETSAPYFYDLLKNYSILSYKIGGQHSYRDFSFKKKFDILDSDYADIESYVNSSTFTLTNLYSKLLTNLVFSSIKHDKSFEHLIDAFDGYHDFNKADSTRYGDLPSKGNIIQNIGTRLVSLWNTIGRLSGYKRLRVVESVQYMTRQDERVSSICAPWHGRVLNLKESVGLIPQHRNCRCTLVPFS